MQEDFSKNNVMNRNDIANNNLAKQGQPKKGP